MVYKVWWDRPPNPIIHREGTYKVGYLISDLIPFPILYMWVNRQDNEDNDTRAFFYRATIVHETMSLWIISVSTCASLSIQRNLIPASDTHFMILILHPVALGFQFSNRTEFLSNQIAHKMLIKPAFQRSFSRESSPLFCDEIKYIRKWVLLDIEDSEEPAQ